MSDLESRLGEALRDGAQDAPGALGLAEAARGRASSRRRTRVAALGAAAVAVLALPVAVVALTGGDEPDADSMQGADPSPTPTPTSPKPFPDGRWETWHGVTVRVPGDWEYGDQSTWCANGGTADQYLVTRPGGPVEAIACSPGSSYGLAFQDIEMQAADEPFDWPVVTQTGEAWPPHTYVGAHGESGVLVTVAGPDRDLVTDVLSTVSVHGPVDPNGCSTTDDGGPGMAGAGEVPVCRYDEEGRLVQSEKLTGEDAAAAAVAVAAAPESTGWDDCMNGPTEYVVMGVAGDRVEVQYAGLPSCGDRGTRVEGVRHDLTSDVLYWALSPGWSGSVEGGVPLPDPLRD